MLVKNKGSDCENVDVNSESGEDEISDESCCNGDDDEDSN